jgi:hypothetical protein
MQREDLITINDKTYKIKQMVVSQSLPLKYKIMDAFGASLLKVLLGEISVFEELTNVDMESGFIIIKQMLHCNPLVTDENGIQINIDKDFTGHEMALYDLFYAVLRTNYEAFFLDARKRFQEYLEKKADVPPPKKKKKQT